MPTRAPFPREGMEDILEGLNARQQAAVLAPMGPVCVTAGAGSGKTTVLSHRYAALVRRGYKPQNIVAITFTNKAAKEMRQRIEKLVGSVPGANIRTFHSFCLKLLKTYPDAPHGAPSGFTVIDEDDKKGLILDCYDELDLDPKFGPKPSNVAAWISKQKDNLRTFEKVQPNDMNRKHMAIYRVYERKLADMNALDFDDLILKAVYMLKYSKPILQQCLNQFRVLLIDEYQDTNRAQDELVKLLSGPEKNVYVVGDADQSIYGFRNSDFRIILEFPKVYPGTTVIKLEQNYRSEPAILDAANSIIKNNENRADKELWTANDGENLIEHHEFTTPEAEAEWIAQKLAEDGKKEGFGKFCILARMHFVLGKIEPALLQYGVPYEMVASHEFLERQEIKDVMSFMRLAINPLDKMAAKRIINVPARGIGPKAAKTVLNAMGDIYDVAANKTLLTGKAKQGLINLVQALAHFVRNSEQDLGEAIIKLVDETGYGDWLTKNAEKTALYEVKKDNINALVNLARNSEAKTADEFIDSLSLYEDGEKDKENDKVLLMTIHSAKGLEFGKVFLPGFEEGILPHSSAVYMANNGNKEQLEEERRLCYVAVTRAKERIYISNCRERGAFGRKPTQQIPSRFLEEIPKILIEEGAKEKQREEAGEEEYRMSYSPF